MWRLVLTRGRIAGIAIGLLTFVATHLVLMTKWTSWFHGQYEPWFLNAASAGQFTAVCVFAVSLIAGLLDISGVSLWLGALAGMTAVMLFPPGPGTLWPIAMALGGLLLGAAVLFGSALGLGIRYLLGRLK